MAFVYNVPPKRSEIKILGKTIKIVRFKNTGRTDEKMGRSDIKAGTIYICDDMPADIANETILHELIHFILDSNAIEKDETTVSVLSNCLYAILKDNDMIKEWRE